MPLPPHPVPSTSSYAPARKTKENSQPSVDTAPVMQSLLQALQQQQPQHSSSESTNEELLHKVFREPFPPPISRESPLAEDLTLSSDEDEGPLVLLLNSPARAEYPAHPVPSANVGGIFRLASTQRPASPTSGPGS